MASLALHVHHGPHLLPLVESLADLLSSPLEDPFEAEVVAVPTLGIRDWLQQQLALRLGARRYQDGVAANIEMVFPGRFIAAALGQRLDADDPWEIERLTWAVVQALESARIDVPGRHAPSIYVTARRIADLFDSYATNRPQLLQQWRAGHDGDGTTDEREAIVPLPPDQRWQPALWREIRELIGVPNRAEQLPELLNMLATGSLQPALPARTALFGVSTVSAAQLSVLGALGQVRDVHLYLVHPSNSAWSRSRHTTRLLEPRANFDATAGVRHPLLRSWGRPALESAALVDTNATIVTEHSPIRASKPSLLRVIQEGIDADESSTPAIVPAGDRTLQVHACHGTTRQLEVLRDTLGHLFNADPTLEARDVVVLCPDLPRFAPLLESVFGRGNLPVPVRVSDLSLGTDNPVAIALTTILDTVVDRCTAPEMLALCSLDAIRTRLGFSDDDMERIDRWIVELNIFWGLDADHRSEWLEAPLDDGTWVASLDRVLLGAAMPAPEPRVGVGTVVPYDDIDAETFRASGRLADLVARLGAVRRSLEGRHPIHTWVDILTDIVSSLCATLPQDAWQLTQVVQAIQALREQSVVGHAPSHTLLGQRDIRSLLKGALGAARGRLALRTGCVSVTALVPVRNIPARVVCILGLDENVLRASRADADDLLALRPCVGERDPRVEGRHLLLDALMATGEHLIITCDGADLTTNRQLPLPVPVSELLDVVAAISAGPDSQTIDVQAADGHAPNGDGMPPVVFRHPRQAFDERNLVADGAGSNGPASVAPGVPFSFDPGMHVAADTRRSAVISTDQFPILRLDVPATVTIDELADACVRPARTYLRGRLDVVLPREIDELDPHIPLDLTKLEMSALGRELLDHHRQGQDTDVVESWRDAQRLAGALPPGELGELALQTVERELEIVLDATPEIRGLIVASDAEPIDLTLAPAEAPGCPVRLVDTVGRIHDGIVVRVIFARPKQRGRLTAALELAALSLMQPERDWQAVVVCRPDRSSNPNASKEWLRPINGADRQQAASALLQVAADLWVRARREPLPLFDQSSEELYAEGEFADESFTADLRDAFNTLLWERYAPDEVLALPIRDDDIPRLAAIAASDGRLPGRAEALANLLWGAFDAFIVSTSTPPPEEEDE